MKRLVIANRGEIARRILRAGRERGYRVAVISVAADKDSMVRGEADDVLEVESFLDGDAVVAAARAFGADLLHPGYGFLSESASFADAVIGAGIGFVGPRAESMRLLGNKTAAKALAVECGVPTLVSIGSERLSSLSKGELAKLLAKEGLEAPYLVKAAAGGGGRGMRIVETAESLPAALRRASEEAAAGFSDGSVFLERLLREPRHIEAQIFGDGEGKGVVLGERECSMQRRHQKVIEEAPSPVVDPPLREALGRAALALVRATKYRGAGTVEFLLDGEGAFYFLEVNTRLQVEHPVTELLYDIDLVHAQFELAEGAWPSELPPPDHDAVIEPPHSNRAVIEARVLAEDPRRGFLPTPGTLHRYREPCGEGIRVDAGVNEGDRVHPEFDSLIAKVIAVGGSRAQAIGRLSMALEGMVVHGATTNLPFLQAVLRHPDFRAGRESTDWIQNHLEELNGSLLPESLSQRMSTPGFREQLSFTMSLDPARGDSGSSSQPSDRFRLQGNERARVGSAEERGALRAAIPSRDGSLLLEGEGLSQALRAVQASSFRYAARLVEAIHRAKENPGPLTVAVIATKLPSAELAITLFGETLCLLDPRRAPREDGGHAPTNGEVRAPMAGKVLEVLVSVGAPVEEGDLLFVIESMKMQLEVTAPVGGTLERVEVAPGDILDGPAPIATIATKPENK